MSYKIVKNANGDVVCFGPNTDQYQPSITLGSTLTIEANLPQRSLAETKTDKITVLEAARKRAIDTMPPVTVAGKQYPANSEYREVVTGIARRKAAGKLIPAKLRGSDGSEITLNAVLTDQIDDAITAAVQAVWDAYWVKFDAVQAATTVAQVDAVTW